MNARLRIYLGTDQRFEHLRTFEWLLHRAQQHGLPGATAVSAEAGFGPHGRRRSLGLDSLSTDTSIIVELVGPRDVLVNFHEQVGATGALDRALSTIEPVELLGE